jgi:hypothetical protein
MPSANVNLYARCPVFRDLGWPAAFFDEGEMRSLCRMPECILSQYFG